MTLNSRKHLHTAYKIATVAIFTGPMPAGQVFAIWLGTKSETAQRLAQERQEERNRQLEVQYHLTYPNGPRECLMAYQGPHGEMQLPPTAREDAARICMAEQLLDRQERDGNSTAQVPGS